ncbi:MAG: hypothetical protein ABIV63_06450 [Caldimonas sp.]
MQSTATLSTRPKGHDRDDFPREDQGAGTRIHRAGKADIAPQQKTA